jgi:cobalt/nickel transport system ATP-binding protein
VYDDVSFSPRNYGYTDHEVEEKVESVLRRVGITHLRHKVCHYLSGGEKRKVALAGALVLDPELLVLDEPFEGLDPSSRNEIVDLLNGLNRDHGVSLVVATHDVQLVAPLADKVYVLKKGGEIVAQGPPAQIFRDLGVLQASNIEPPVLAELFQKLELRGIALGRPATPDEAVKVLLEWFARDGREAAAPAPKPVVTLPAPAPSPPPARPQPAEMPPSAAPDLFAGAPPGEGPGRP